MAFWDFEKDVCTIDKNKTETIIVQIVTKNKKDYVLFNIVKRGENDESYSYTGKTVAIPVDIYPTIHEKIKEVLKEE